MEGLKDIKGIVEMHSNWLYFWIGLALLLTAVLLYSLFKIYQNKLPKKRKKPTLKELAFKELQSIDFNDTKMVAYKFTQNFSYFLNEENSSKFEELEKRLEVYKYKKIVPELDESLKDEIKSLIGGINDNI
ncbi:MAG: hypothetical protein GX282_08655 [Campylobacteraceae bacterium]|mgnify:CR=1 FL=1|nr:hypothetical protein [Campylobacteraceae bacterium]